MPDDHIVKMNDDQFKKVIDAAYELEKPDTSLLPNAADSTILGEVPPFFQQTYAGAGLSDPTEDEGADLFYSLFRTMLEQNYILGKMTKNELIESLRKLYDDGLDIAETIEEIEITKERFIRRIVDQAKKELREELKDGLDSGSR